ncbi:hypothetical protein IRJ41_012263 [Triplophysa rosa]|uniref:Uncharacterized protein n=1 Tax=Triplophysa rosa TaxID=992332 RepID=A0A9W7T948_TRIRA|nr:hypothetical protein IRJ41_012263 [Triplophysa rosa]
MLQVSGLMDYWVSFAGGTSIPGECGNISKRDRAREKEICAKRVGEMEAATGSQNIPFPGSHLLTGSGGPFRKNKETENEEEWRLSRHEPRQQEELTSILSAHKNIHSGVCNFQQVDPRGVIYSLLRVYRGESAERAAVSEARSGDKREEL